MNLNIRRRAKEVRKNQSGATVVIVALLLTVLLGMAAFALDFGWLYWNVIKVQHGADAAALSGVIYEPNNRTQAYVQAVQAASENGYNPADAGTAVVPVDFVDDPSAVENSHQLRVTVTDAVPTFFMKVFGVDTISITKHAIAEYILPLPIGSPESTFGNDPATGYDPGFWGNIHGYKTDTKQGDRYSSQCTNGNSGSGCPANASRRETVYPNAQEATGGYLYGIEFETDPSSVTVEIFDGPMTSGGGDPFLTGDQVPGYSSDGTLPTTVFILYGPDPTPLNTSDNEVLCTVTYPPRGPYFDPNGDGQSNDADDLTGDGVLDWDDLNEPYLADGSGGLLGGVASLWDEMCPLDDLDRGIGVYPLRVFTLADGNMGLNRWSLRASGGTASAAVYGLGDMALYSNVNNGLTEFYLAEVIELHKGKDLVIGLWDPGDASGNHSIDILNPAGGVATCSWTSTNSAYPGEPNGPCNIATSSKRFNGHLLEIRVELPTDYACEPGPYGCWWKIRYHYPKQATDTTTWEARIEGNPVKLIE
jgi:Flp pilus assembly protein TadG